MNLREEIQRLQQSIVANAGYIQCLKDLTAILEDNPQAGVKSLRKFMVNLQGQKERERLQNLGGLQLANKIVGSQGGDEDVPLLSGKRKRTLPVLEEDEKEEEEFGEDYGEEGERPYEEPFEEEVRTTRQRPQTPNRKPTPKRSGIVNFGRAGDVGPVQDTTGPISEEDASFFK